MPCILFAVTTTLSVAVFILSASQQWYSAHLYMTLSNRVYLTIDDRSAYWTIRVGNVGGISDFDAGFTKTDPIIHAMRSELKPFPVTWITDWFFEMQRGSPYLLIITPLYFPALILSVWPLRTVQYMRKVHQTN